jgi:hypothetical protein
MPRKKIAVISAVITPPSFAARHLPQVVPVSATQGWFGFWLRTVISTWHVSVLGLFAPFERYDGSHR